MKQSKKEKKPEKQKERRSNENDHKKQPSNAVQEQKGLTKEDLPDSTNESTGRVGSGLRQDSN